jgi:hypothetical protein
MNGSADPIIDCTLAIAPRLNHFEPGQGTFLIFFGSSIGASYSGTPLRMLKHSARTFPKRRKNS